MTRAVFRPTGVNNGLYDLVVDGRTRDTDLEQGDFSDALRRVRLPLDTQVYVEDESGHQDRLPR